MEKIIVKKIINHFNRRKKGRKPDLFEQDQLPDLAPFPKYMKGGNAAKITEFYKGI